MLGRGMVDNEMMFEEFWKAYPSECPITPKDCDHIVTQVA